VVDLVTELPGSGGGGNAGSSFSDQYFNIYSEGEHSKILAISLSDAAIATLTTLRVVSTVDLVVTIPSSGAVDTFITAFSANVFFAIQEFDFDGSVTRQVWKLHDTDIATTLNVLGPTFLSGDRTQSFPDASGMYTVVGVGADPPAAGFMGKVNRTAQAADIASVKLTDTCPVGQYLIAGELECTTGAGGAGTVTVTFSWTNDSGAKTSAVTLSLATAGSTPILIPAYLASGDVSWAVTHTGLYLTSQYALRVRPISLG